MSFVKELSNKSFSKKDQIKCLKFPKKINFNNFKSRSPKRNNSKQIKPLNNYFQNKNDKSINKSINQMNSLKIKKKNFVFNKRSVDQNKSLQDYKIKKLVIKSKNKILNQKNQGNFLKGVRKGHSNDNFITLKNKQKTSLSPYQSNLRPIKSKISDFDLQSQIDLFENSNQNDQKKNLSNKYFQNQQNKDNKQRIRTLNLKYRKKNQKSQERKNSNKNKKIVQNYLNLNRKFQAKARSNDKKTKIKELNTNFGKHTKNIKSWDKDQNSLRLNQIKPPIFQTKTTAEYTNQYNKPKQQNKYYNHLIQKLKDGYSQDIIKIIKNSFNKWDNKQRAEFYSNFQTSSVFYEIKKSIGKGCFGEVYLAKQILTGRRVALKAIKKNNLQSKDALKKIYKEVKILKKVNNNPGIAKLYECFEDSDFVFMVFEYAEMGDLVQYFKINPLLEEQELKVFFKKIVLAIKYLHKKNIIHRDIKLDNILLDKEMNPKICDFGISSEYDQKNPIMDTGGTPAYLAPEVIQAKGNVCPKSDIWSLGVLLFLLGFGYVPFQASSMQSLYSKILEGKFSFPKEDYLSYELIDLIKKMMVVDIKKRLDIDEVLNHSWLRKVDVSQKKERISSTIKEKNQQKIQAINYFLEDVGIPRTFIQQTIQKNLFNHVKACRDTLMIRFGIVQFNKNQFIKRVLISKKISSLIFFICLIYDIFINYNIFLFNIFFKINNNFIFFS